MYHVAVLATRLQATVGWLGGVATWNHRRGDRESPVGAFPERVTRLRRLGSRGKYNTWPPATPSRWLFRRSSQPMVDYGDQPTGPLPLGFSVRPRGLPLHQSRTTGSATLYCSDHGRDLHRIL